MRRTDPESRALRRDMLRVRAAAERAELVARLDELDNRTRRGRAVVGALLGHRPTEASGLLRFAASVMRIVRSRPWLVPAVIGTMTRVARSRTLRWIALAAAAGGIWWVRRQRSSAPRLEDPLEELPAYDDDA